MNVLGRTRKYYISICSFRESSRFIILPKYRSRPNLQIYSRTHANNAIITYRYTSSPLNDHAMDLNATNVCGQTYRCWKCLGTHSLLQDKKKKSMLLSPEHTLAINSLSARLDKFIFTCYEKNKELRECPHEACIGGSWNTMGLIGINGRNIFDLSLCNEGHYDQTSGGNTEVKTSEEITPSPDFNNKEGRSDLPSDEQLTIVFNHIVDKFPGFFTDRSMTTETWLYHHTNIEFIDNIRGKSARGIYRYILCMVWIKLLVNSRLKDANFVFDILKITKHVDEGTIKVRWSMSGTPVTQVYQVWNLHKMMTKEEDFRRVWYDGFSTFYVNSTGNIWRHVADSVIPDNNREIRKLSLFERLGLRFGVGKIAAVSKQYSKT